MGARLFKRLFFIVCVIAGFEASDVEAAKIPLTIIHTNDVHSHYKPSKGPFGLGGVARIATIVKNIRKEAPASLLFDGGDWSEGSIYYNLDGGRTALEILNAMGYDATVLGNHDWLNGPDHLVDLFKQNPPKYYVLGANLNLSKFKRATELPEKFASYHVFEAGGVRVGVIGVETFERIYDKYLKPITIEFPYPIVRKAAARLKHEFGADIVVVISHNNWPINKYIAGLANVDIVIHAHDHQKHAKPLVVERRGKRAVAVEAGQWGQYVGRLDIMVDTDEKNFEVKNYKLVQVDSTIVEDPKIAAMVSGYDKEIVKKYGDIFGDHVADNEIDLWQHENNEGLWGNLLTDAYREFTHADVAFEQVSFTVGGLHRGQLSTADIYNALTAVYDVKTDKAWTLSTTRMKGSTIFKLMNKLLAVQSFLPDGVVNVSGMHAIWDPTVIKKVSIFDDANKWPLKSLDIGGKPIEMDRSYVVALPHGLVETLSFLEHALDYKIDRTEQHDTGVEDWRVLAQYVRRHSPIRTETVPRGGRISVVHADLALYADEISSIRGGAHFSAKVKIRNMGSSTSGSRKLSVTYEKTPEDSTDDPNPSAQAMVYDVAPIVAGGWREISVDLELPGAFAKIPVPIYFALDPAGDDPITANDDAWYFSLPSHTEIR